GATRDSAVAARLSQRGGEGDAAQSAAHRRGREDGADHRVRRSGADAQECRLGHQRSHARAESARAEADRGELEGGPAMMMAIFATLLAALVLDWRGARRCAVICLMVCLILTVGL